MNLVLACLVCLTLCCLGLVAMFASYRRIVDEKVEEVYKIVKKENKGDKK